MPRLRGAWLGVVVGILAAGCTSGGSDKGGGSGEPVSLRMADGYQDLSFEPAVADFVNRVRELSHGQIRIDVTHGWGNYQAGFEQQIVKDVASDKADLGWVGTRVFDTLDVKSFQALTAPMLIDSYPLERAVIASDIPGQMLKSLRPLGVTGLAVLGGGLRKPIGVHGPFLRPADWKGITFEAIRSDGQAEAVQSLGAEATDVFSSALEALIDAGDVQGFEKDLHIFQLSDVTKWPYVTANVNLWPQTAVLLANPKRLAGLSDDQRGWLRQAASDAASHSTSLFDRTDAGIVGATCRRGARFADATEADLVSLRTAFGPAYASLEADTQTKGFIEGIQRLKQSMPPGTPLPLPAGCTGPAQGTTGSVSAVDQLTGRWESGRLGESDIVRAFVAAGGSEKEGHAFFAQLGTGSSRYAVVTLTFQRGVFEELESADGGPGVHGYSAPYRIGEDGAVTITAPDCTGTYRFTVTGSSLRLRPVARCEADSETPYLTTLIASFPMTSTTPRITDGVYRATVSEAFLRSRGALSSEAADNGGTHSLTIAGSRWTDHQARTSAPAVDCGGTLAYSEGRVSVFLDVTPDCPNPTALVFSARWTLRSGQLRFVDIEPSTDVLTVAFWGGKPWEKIG